MTWSNTEHHYRTRLAWSGNTKAGYRGYSRAHRAAAPPAAEISLSADPSFRGDPGLTNPEQLLVMAASSCQLLSFLSVAVIRRLEILEYSDEAQGDMPTMTQPMRIARIVLHPMVTVAAGTDVELVEQLVHEAHSACYIANTLNADVVVRPTIVTS